MHTTAVWSLSHSILFRFEYFWKKYLLRYPKTAQRKIFSESTVMTIFLYWWNFHCTACTEQQFVTCILQTDCKVRDLVNPFISTTATYKSWNCIIYQRSIMLWQIPLKHNIQGSEQGSQKSYIDESPRTLRSNNWRSLCQILVSYVIKLLHWKSKSSQKN